MNSVPLSSISGGGSRAIGADGLPILDKSTIRVQGRGEISGSFSQDFLSAESVSLSFPVGDTVELKVSVLTPSARWSSPPLKITVEPGTNAVGVKLSKKTAAFHNFLFSRHLGTGMGSSSSFTLKLEDGTDILSNVQTHAGSLPAFVRNGKGGIYVVYAEPSSSSEPQSWKMFFYDSEGKNRREVILPSVHRVRKFIPASDFTTGQIYAASVPDSGSGKLYRRGQDSAQGGG